MFKRFADELLQERRENLKFFEFFKLGIWGIKRFLIHQKNLRI